MGNAKIQKELAKNKKKKLSEIEKLDEADMKDFINKNEIDEVNSLLDSDDAKTKESEITENDKEKELDENFMPIYERINYKLSKAKFNEEQTQAFYEIFNSEILPIIKEIKEDFDSYRELEKLENYFGGKENLQEVSRQILAWGKNNLKDDIFQTLSKSYDGVLALYQMMQSKEPKIINKTEKNDKTLTEQNLKKMMENPKYWRDNDPAYIKKIEDGFKKLYT